MADTNTAERLADELGACLTSTDQHGDAAWVEWDSRRAAAVIREAQAIALESAAEWFTIFAQKARGSSVHLMKQMTLAEERDRAAAVLSARATELREDPTP